MISEERPKIIEIIVTEKVSGQHNKREIIVPVEMIQGKTRNEVRKFLREEAQNYLEKILNDRYINELLGYNLR